jgi:nucleotidyltransferase substrate binding protein (TIGR01987 family)
MAFKDVMRTAADANLIRDPKMFLLYREKRNLTSHTYDPTKAEEVLEDMDAFVSDVRYVIEQLRRRNLGTAH